MPLHARDGRTSSILTARGGGLTSDLGALKKVIPSGSSSSLGQGIGTASSVSGPWTAQAPGVGRSGATINAMGCQKETAAANVGDGSQHVLIVKEKQPHLDKVIQRAVDEALEQGEPGVDLTKSQTQAVRGGRQEIRTCCVTTNPRGIRDVGPSPVGEPWGVGADRASPPPQRINGAWSGAPRPAHIAP
jgi:hypothetical protein